MKFFNMVGKHCARCTGGIYTVWRTSANKKYYHPHCFTCAICNVVLENTQECGISTLKEIYCRECFRSYFSDNGRRTNNRSCSISEEIEYEILKQHAHSLRHREQEQSPRAVRSDRTSPRRYHDRISSKRDEVQRDAIDHDKDLSEGSSDTSNKAALQKPPHNNNKEGNSRHTYMTNTPDLNYEKMVKPYGVERKVSRIPRPTSATSKKCLTSNPTKTCVSVKKLTNATTECPRSPIAKMGRSVSLVQPSTQQRTNHSNLVSTGTGTSTTSFFCPSTPRPSSASPSTTPTKRQCAASFSTSNNALRNVELQRNPAQIKPSLARTERSMKSGYFTGIPSTQDILSVIRRESSDLINFTNLNLINRPGYGSDVASALPRNIYNITFDCPICIGSLVHSGGIHNPKEGGSKGNVVTHCGHLFHRECMESWLRIKGNNRCPICSTLCVPETLQSVYLECNVSVDENSRTILAKEISKFDQNRTVNEAFQVLKSEYDILKARFDEMIAENEEFSFKAAIASSLQSAYDMECRNRLQLQWENKKLIRQMEELQHNRH